MIACTAAALYTPLERIERPVVLIDDGVIAEIASGAALPIPPKARVVDFGDAVLAPGFIDIHIHGGAGHDVMESDPGALPCVEAFLLKHGVTTYFPTTVTAPLDATLAALDRLADAMEDKANGNGQRARPLGIHLEGPFISNARRGVHPPEYLLMPTLPLFEQFWQASRGHIKVMTIAPELQGAQEVIQEASRRGVCVSLGHSDADLGTARSAKAAGALHATHTFNAMRPLSHRDPGILGLVLTDANMTADIIADGIHVDPAVVELFVKLKGPERAVLITDATSAAGMPDGHYRLGSFELEVRNGKCILGDKLAGSVLTMDRAVRNVMKFANLELQHALRTASLNPAKVVGISRRHGILAPGADADIVVLNQQNEVIKTIARGAGI
jgi:N-acetylglucosamine-6-phosphate deacetylase